MTHPKRGRVMLCKRPIAFTTDYGGEWKLSLQSDAPIREIDWADVDHLVDQQKIIIITPAELAAEIAEAEERATRAAWYASWQAHECKRGDPMMGWKEWFELADWRKERGEK